MKAIFFDQIGSIHGIRFGDLKLPRPNLKEGEIRVSFLAGSLNHLDLWVVKGLSHLKYQFPHIAGADFCGQIVESKSGKFSVDQKVLLYPGSSDRKEQPENLSVDFGIRGENVQGVFCEELVIHERFVSKMPEHLSVEEAAAIPLVYLTAWQMIVEKAEIDKLRSGPVLIHGAGSGVSQAIMELLLCMNISDLHVTSRRSEKLIFWQKRGLKTHLWSETMYRDLKSVVGPERFAVIFDHVGKEAFDMNVKLLRNGGRLVSCGATSGFDVSLDLRQIFFRQLEIRGSTMGSIKHFHQVLEFISTHRLKPKISGVYDWSQPQTAYQAIESGLQDGKIVLTPMH
jgi:NADPH:quinone reductase-like Zn-dependent oxidoreductase